MVRSRSLRVLGRGAKGTPDLEWFRVLGSKVLGPLPVPGDTVIIKGSRDRNVIVRHKFPSNGSTNVAPVFGITGENVEAITGLEQDEKRACHATAATLY